VTRPSKALAKSKLRLAMPPRGNATATIENACDPSDTANDRRNDLSVPTILLELDHLGSEFFGGGAISRLEVLFPRDSAQVNASLSSFGEGQVGCILCW